MTLVFGLFLVLHGLAHLLYLGQSARLFELQSGMVWPDQSWAFAWLASPEPVRLLASIACLLAAVGFVAGGAALLAGQGWWRETTVASAVFATAAWLLFWNATFDDLSGQGGISVLINAAILLGVRVFPRPDLVS
jgi:hypothetical protein